MDRYACTYLTEAALVPENQVGTLPQDRWQTITGPGGGVLVEGHEDDVWDAGWFIHVHAPQQMGQFMLPELKQLADRLIEKRYAELVAHDDRARDAVRPLVQEAIWQHYAVLRDGGHPPPRPSYRGRAVAGRGSLRPGVRPSAHCQRRGEHRRPSQVQELPSLLRTGAGAPTHEQMAEHVVWFRLFWKARTW